MSCLCDVCVQAVLFITYNEKVWQRQRRRRRRAGGAMAGRSRRIVHSFSPSRIMMPLVRASVRYGLLINRTLRLCVYMQEGILGCTPHRAYSSFRVPPCKPRSR